MGYHAPSAEEFYRYAFRLDRPQSLRDRFGFSIVLVNDNSPVCREFLQRYCVDLCLRTAERIRFVFFSEIPTDKFQRVADDMNRGLVDTQSGMLRQVLGMVGDASRFDYEGESWRALRPEALRPLRNIDEIERQLSLECDTRTAMPGTGIAMTFAQRLGIGRHMPCIVIFTEIGELRVDLLPMTGLSADEVFAHTREWIDTFYEHNRTRIDHWRAVEDEIQALVQRASTTLQKIRSWRDVRTAAWRHLVVASEAIHDLEVGDLAVWTRLSDSVKQDWSSPPMLREGLAWAVEARRSIERQRAEVGVLERAAQDVEEATFAERLQDVLTGLRETLPSSLRPQVLEEAIQGLDERQNPRRELRSWWLRSGALRLAFSSYKRHRTAWASLPLRARLKHREEYGLVLGALGNLQLAADPADGADAVAATLARGLGIDANAESFRTASAAYRDIVRDFLRVASVDVPPWLLAWAPEIKIGEAFPLGEDLSPQNVSRLLADRPLLRDALASARAQGDPELAARDKEAASRWRQLVLAELRSSAASLADSDAQLRGIREKALAQLQAARRKIEAEALTSTGGVPHAGDPLDPRVAARLHEALDEYDRVTKSIEFPHRKDRLIRKVPVAISILDAAGIAVAPKPGASVQLRSSLAEATDLDSKTATARRQALEEVENASPAWRLENALRSSLRSERFSALAPDLAQLVRERRANRLLQSLEPHEMQDVGAALGASANPDSMLAALGLYNGAPVGSDENSRMLAAKVRDDDFDVFMAHNSRDKEIVLEIARELRDVGVHPWIDVEQIAPGRWFQDAIQSVIPRVRAAALFLGPNGVGRWQVLELRTFVSQCIERSLPVIPVLLPGVESIPADLLFLREMHAVCFTAGPHDAQALAQLRWGITGERRASA